MDLEAPGSSTIQQNIRSVAELERTFRRERTVGDRIVDGITGVVGSLPYLLLHVAAVTAWVLWNLGRLPGLRPFDPYPFSLLAVLLTGEAMLVALIVLMKQNRMSRQADHRAHLTLQIDLLAEREITKILQILQGLRAGSAESDPEIQELSQDTAVEELSAELRRQLPSC